MNAPVDIHKPPYGPAAYRGDAVPAQPPHKWRQDAKRGSLTRTPLRWGDYTHSEPWQDVDFQLRGDTKEYLERTGQTDLYVNHQRWRFENFNKLLILIPALKWCSLLFVPWLIWVAAMVGVLSEPTDWLIDNFGVGWGGVLLGSLVIFSFAMMGLSMWFMSEQSRYRRYLIQVGLGFAIALFSSLLTFQTSEYGTDLFWLCAGMAFSVLMGLVGWDFLLDLYLRLFQHDGSELNRQTGMVTVARRFRKPFTAPFYEFDATMEFRPGPHGSGGMAIWLHHRYHDFEVFLGGKLQSLGMTREECLAFWDTLQRYMDVSQPLPELPVLEQFRHLDSTTAAHDATTGRPPRRWRDTKYRVWERKERPAMMERNQKHPWQQHPCIIEAAINPALSIEAYYRSQEAKGIQATPKADDFDNVHRS
ncbi:hypothetical protein ACPESN_09985 [Stutzerimonas marianensis]|uniref:hypothetical protein n=1 Tax=Stutzerimonas marianensis TaxID=2929513 RepID=UPI003C2FF5FF